MRVEMLQGEADLLREACGGTIPEPTVKLFLAVRANMLRMGSAFPLGKFELAMIATLSNAVVPTVAEPPESRVHETNGHSDPTPDDELSESEKEAIEARYRLGDTDAAYKGNRIKWQTEFKSTPKTPVAKLEKGRPITYVSQKDGVRRGARFIRVLKDKTKCSIESSEMKKPFSIPISMVEITDLSPPSNQPLAVQI